MLIHVTSNPFFPIRDVKMGYRRLKETVKEYKRRDAKLYGNMISKLSKVEDTEGNDHESQGQTKKRGLWPLAELLRRFFTADGTKGSRLWLVLRLLILVVLVVAICVGYYMQSGVQEIDCINC